MASSSSILRSLLGPPFLYFQFSFAPSTMVICGTIHDLSVISYQSLSPFLSTLFSEDDWVDAIVTLSQCSIDYLFCKMHKILILLLPSDSSRHNSPSRPHYLTKQLSLTTQIVNTGSLNIVLVTSKVFTYPLSAAISKAYPLFSMKANPKHFEEIFVDFCLTESDKEMLVEDRRCLTCLSDGIRRAQLIVDTPTNMMDTDGFFSQILQVYNSLKTFGVTLTVIEGDELMECGLGGIFGVGKQASSLPKLVILSYIPIEATLVYSWVGKGIVYDTGGLSLKPKGFMAGMKRDCGGAAAILGAFYALVTQDFSQTLHAILCLAENAIGPKATRPDDIHTLYSGKTVEINNPDAEGRLILGDGVAYAERKLGSNVIFDMATLTGAQGPTTGKFHGAILSNSAIWEAKVMKAGRITGDCVFPIVYCPELHLSEFDSEIADMKNSVADYYNATSSCAGLFIASHLSSKFSGSWVHLDMAATVASKERATGYGVGLLVGLFGSESNSDYLKFICTSDEVYNLT